MRVLSAESKEGWSYIVQDRGRSLLTGGDCRCSLQFQHFSKFLLINVECVKCSV